MRWSFWLLVMGTVLVRCPATIAQEADNSKPPLPPPAVASEVVNLPTAPTQGTPATTPAGPGSTNLLPKANGSASVAQSDKKYPVGPLGIAAYAGVAPDVAVVDLGARAWIDEELKASGCKAATGTPILLSSQKKWIASYRLKYGAIPLAETSGASLLLKADGRVTSGRWRNIPKRVDATVATVTADAARDRALLDFKKRTGITDARMSGTAELQVWVDVKFDGYLAWAFTIESNDPRSHLKARYHVSATRPDQVLDVRDALADSYTGAVHGTAWTKTSSDPAASVGMPGLMVQTTAGPGAKTDPTGAFHLDGTGKTSFSCALKTDGFRIVTLQGNPLARSRDGDDTGPINLDFAAANEYETAQLTALYWAERTREMLGPVLDGRLANLTTYVNREQPYQMLGNAYFDPSDTSLNFFRAAAFPSGKVFRNTAAPDIVPHEFGHAVDHSYGGMLDAGLSEGLGDCLMIFMTHQPRVGQGIVAPGRPYRDDSVAISFPSATEQHDQGQAFGGFVWEAIRRLQLSPSNLTEAAAYDLMKDLVVGVIVDNSNSIPSAVQIMFQIDDDDQDLSNGTPHSDVLIAAAASRSIPVSPDLPRLALPTAGFVPAAANFTLPMLTTSDGRPDLISLMRTFPLQGQHQSFIYYYK